MADSERIQRWREAKRQKGMKALTVWMSAEEELRLKDLALTCHCSPSAILQQALAQFAPTGAPGISNGTDTEQIQALIQEALAPLKAELVAVTDTVNDTVTATLARELPMLVRQHVAELALESLGVSVTDTNGDVADTEEDVTDTDCDVADTLGKASGPLGERAYVTVAGNSIVTETEPAPRPDEPPTSETRRERILAAVPLEGDRGITIKALADQLGLDYNTVKNNVRTLRQHKHVQQSTGAQGGGYVRPRL